MTNKPAQKMPKVYNKYHKDAPSDAVYVGRPSKWGNPFAIGKDGDRDTVINKYRAWLYANEPLIAEARRELKDKDLLCFCAPQKCHGDILLELSNSPAPRYILAGSVLDFLITPPPKH